MPFSQKVCFFSPHFPKQAALLAILFSLLLTSCATKTYFPKGNVQRGLASWYGDEFHGRLTSNREVYDMHAMTAAHKTLPFGTYVRVINLNSGKSVIVRINDRGPFIKDRIIDLSYAAARRLGVAEMGVAPVEIRVLKKFSPKKSSQKFSVQVAAFEVRTNALKLRNQLLRRYNNVYISKVKTPAQTFYRVKISVRSMEAAQNLAEKLRKKGYSAQALEDLEG